ncbi:helix-turn-helix domain-containing protein [Sphingobium yanoikuyae]|uniref:HTH araC/xylS-type domain-containing protein n=1 Tax=Sphingobium yanoikuyae TaxID=13690 RepID=A0A291MZR8_SPHYA|nr:helix-turn-helix domain-containing protein [Sphingobium yanoikuyae]ATI80654.1 hypothetical protein A6768_12075 [Sphingobium yanoikuyae]
MSRDFAVVAFDGVHLASAGLLLDLFALMRRRVADQFSSRDDIGMHTKVRLLGQGNGTIRVSDGRRLKLDDGLIEHQPHLLVHVPDFEWPDTDMAAGLQALGGTIEWLARQHADGAHISATGRAVHLLAEAGLLGSGPVPIARSAAKPFRLHYSHIRTDIVTPILDQRAITMARGMAHEMRMLTRLIGRFMSITMAGSLAEAMGLEEAEKDGLSDDPLVAAAQIWLAERASRGTRISALATDLAVSQQTLIRRFRARLGMTPRDYLRLLRVRSAQSQLRDTTRSIAQIATLVGYDDLRSFQEVFRTYSGMSASRYRIASRAAPRPD